MLRSNRYINNFLTTFKSNGTGTGTSVGAGNDTTQLVEVTSEVDDRNLTRLPLSFPIVVDEGNGATKTLHHQIYPVDYRIPIRLDVADDSIVHSSDTPDHECHKDSKGRYSIRLTCMMDIMSPHLPFEQITRKVGPSSQLVISRFANTHNDIVVKIPESRRPIIFKSQVVSRIHGCFKVDVDGNWYIQDKSSSGGTFLNNIRLSNSKKMSKDFLLRDNDVLQFGVTIQDNQGSVFNSVKLRVELNQSWKHKKMTIIDNPVKDSTPSLDVAKLKESCSICLLKLEKSQPFFVSHCKHYWHFSCILPLIQSSYPSFTCPNCRSFIEFESFGGTSSSQESSDDDNGDSDQFSTNSSFTDTELEELI